MPTFVVHLYGNSELHDKSLPVFADEMEINDSGDVLFLRNRKGVAVFAAGYWIYVTEKEDDPNPQTD